jgi:hypothetical protein
MKKAELFEFLDTWNQQDKAKDGFKPINQYQLHAYLLGQGFHLKWYLSKKDFIAIAKELDYDLEAEQADKIIFKYGDQNIELELQPEE